MAIKIQRAWRRYKTRKILSNISKIRNARRDSHPFHILDEFTDEENDEKEEAGNGNLFKSMSVLVTRVAAD